MDSTNNNIAARIKELHGYWNKVTGQGLPLRLCDFERESGWLAFIKSDYGEKEIDLVVRYLRDEIAKGNRQPAALRWSVLIGNLNRFDEEMELARGSARKPKRTPLDRVLAQARPQAAELKPDDHASKAIPVSEVIKALRAAVR